MGSYPYYVEGELAAARRDKAPADVIYRTDGVWRRFADVTNAETRARVEAILRDMPA